MMRASMIGEVRGLRKVAPFSPRMGLSRRNLSHRQLDPVCEELAIPKFGWRQE